MSRQIVQLHTLDQWLTIPRENRSVILQHIRLKDRLQSWLKKQSESKTYVEAPTWVPCKHCGGTDHPGWTLRYPRSPGIHPSQLIHPCLRRIYWQMEGREETERFEARTLLIFDIGHAVHDMLQGYGKKGAWGPVYSPEARVSENLQPFAAELMVEGSADAENILTIDDIPNAPIFEVGLVHEYKTINSKAFEKLTRPKPEHKRQATIYAKMLNRPVVVYLYFSKNDAALADFPVEFEPEVWAPLEDKCRYLVDLYEKQHPPQTDTGHHCLECGFFSSCPEGQAAQRPRGRR